LRDRNENRPRYKKTKLGWIPADWECIALRYLAKEPVVNGLFKRPHEYGSGTLLVNVIDTYNNIVIDVGSLDRVQTSENEIKKYANESGDLFFVRSSLKLEGIGNCCVLFEDQIQSVFECHLIRYRPDQTKLDPLYTTYQCTFHSLRKQLMRSAQTTTMTTLPQSEVEKCLIPLPPLPEQKKISEILSTWDRAIEQTRKLIRVKKGLKKALMQQLLDGRTQMEKCANKEVTNKKFPDSWQILRAREIFKPISIKNHSNEPVLSVTQDAGVVYRNSLDRKIEASEENTGSYKLVEPGDFVISLRSFQGGLEYCSYRGIVSPAYHVIRPTKEIDDTFYKYYFKSYDFIGHLAISIIGIRDGKQVNFSDFSFMELPYPPVEQQTAIGKTLKVLDEEIKLFGNKLMTLEKQKRGLMQKLLTGEVRVKT
jgi:type I restriction enzyme S subunit